MGILTGGRCRPHWLDLIDLHVFQYYQVKTLKHRPPNPQISKYLSDTPAPSENRLSSDPRPMRRFSAQRSLHNLKRIKDPERRDLHVPLSSGVRYLVIVAVVGSEVRKTSCGSYVCSPTLSSRLPLACSYFPSRRPIDSWHAVSLQPQKVIPGSKECVF